MKLEGTKRAVAFGAIVLGFFMALLDTTIVNVALPDMTAYFGASMGAVSWVANGYNLAFAVFLITASRLADQFGRKRLFILGVVLFVVFSVSAGFAGSLRLLIVFRVLQGLAAAIVVPVTIPLAMELFPPRMHGTIIGLWGAIAGLAAASGPALGGLLTASTGWQAVFHVNVPIGAACVILSLLLLKESRDPTAGRRLDWAGMLLLSGAMFALAYALIQSNEWGWGSARVTGLLGASLLLSAGFVAVEKRLREPMLPLWLFRIPVFNWANVTLLIIGAGVMVPSYLMSYFLTGLMGKTVLQAGLIISAMPLASMVASAVIGPLSSRYGSRYFTAGGMVVLALSVYSFGSLTPASELTAIVLRLAASGVGIGLSMAPVMGAVVRNVPQDKVGMASGVTNMTKALGSVLGVALLVTVLSGASTHAIQEAREDVGLWIGQEQALTPEVRAVLGRALENGSERGNASGASGSNNNQETRPDGSSGGKAAGSGNSSTADRAALNRILAELREKVPQAAELANKAEARFLQAATDSFAKTFHLAGLALLPGIAAGLLSDKRKAKDVVISRKIEG